LLEAQLLRAGYAVGNSDGEQIAEKPRSEDNGHIFSAVNYSVSAEPVQTSTDFGMTSYFRVGSGKAFDSRFYPRKFADKNVEDRREKDAENCHSQHPREDGCPERLTHLGAGSAA